MSKKDLLMEMPAGVEEQKAIKNSIKEVVDSLVRIEAEKDLISSIYEVSEEKYGVSKKFIKSQADLMYDKLYGDSKKRQKIEEAAEMVDIYDGVFGD